MSILSGWNTACRYLGDSSPMRIRRAVKRGQLRATQNPDKTYSFDTVDLDAFKATVRTAASIAGAIAAPRTNTGTAQLAPAVTTTSAVIVPASAPSALAWADAFAASGQHARDNDNEHADDDVEAEETRTGRPTQPPLGSIPMSRWLSSYPSSASQQLPPQTLDVARIAELEQQVAELQATLDASRRQATRERVSAIAHAIGLEAVMSGASAQLAIVARDAAGAAVETLSDTQLTDPTGYAIATARMAAMAATQQVDAAISWQHEQAQAARYGRGGDDLARARRRRSSRRW